MSYRRDLFSFRCTLSSESASFDLLLGRIWGQMVDFGANMCINVLDWANIPLFGTNFHYLLKIVNNFVNSFEKESKLCVNRLNLALLVLK